MLLVLAASFLSKIHMEIQISVANYPNVSKIAIMCFIAVLDLSYIVLSLLESFKCPEAALKNKASKLGLGVHKPVLMLSSGCQSV